MAVVLSPDQESATQKFLATLSESGVSCISRATAIKFLLARKFDVIRAHALWKQHEATRRREGLYKFDPFEEPLKSELETGKFTILPSRDPTGAAIALFTANKHYPKSTTHQATLQGVVYQLDVALESVDTQRAGLVFIYDMTDSKFTNFDYDLSTKILTMLKGGYPAKLRKVLIVTAPLWFKAPFRVLRLFVHEKLRERVYTVAAHELSQHIFKAALPKDLGGTLEFDHAAWLEHCRNCYANNLQNSKLDEYVISNHINENKQNGVVVVDCEMSGENRLESDMHLTGESPVFTDIRNTYNGDTNSMKSRHINSDDEDLDSSSEEDRDAGPEQSNVKKRVRTAANPRSTTAVPGSSNCHKRKRGRSWSPSSGGGGAGAGVEAEVRAGGGAEVRAGGGAEVRAGGGAEVRAGGGAGVTAAGLVAAVRAAGRRGLHGQYDLIRTSPPRGTFHVGRLPANLAKNRYTDVLCYDHTRVVLSTSDPADPTSDYINANYVDGYKQKNAFISTQGPLPKTFSDFWRMVWEQQSLVIVMTTKAVERGRIKCGQYWPPTTGSTQVHGDYKVHTESVEDHEDYVITHLKLTHTPSLVSRLVWHGQYVRWPDYGVPGGGGAGGGGVHHVLRFHGAVRGAQEDSTRGLGDKWVGHSKGPPIIVHCSAGIGRTGTFLTLDICIQRLNAEGVVDIKGTVEQIRAQRAYSIQMPDQYVFCHLALIEYAVMHGYLESADLTGFDQENDSESE